MFRRLPWARLVAPVALIWAFGAGASPVFTTFEGTGSTVAVITPVRDAFRIAVGGGTVAGANGSFGGVRREINWDGVPDARSDPNPLPADFFNTTSPRGVVFGTPGTGFVVSANAGLSTPPLFGFPSDFQAFSAQKVFSALNSNVTDVRFFLPGTTTQAVTTAFGLIFVDVEVADTTRIDFFDENDLLVFSRTALVAGNQGFSFVGATVSDGAIGRVRITSGRNTIVGNGVLGNTTDDVVVMDDFVYAEPGLAARAVPEPSSLPLLGIGLVVALTALRRLRCR